jgi:hypothetical protein
MSIDPLAMKGFNDPRVAGLTYPLPAPDKADKGLLRDIN